MRKIIISIVFLLAGINAAVFAQCDPQFGLTPTYTGTTTVNGTQTILVGQTGQLTFDFGVGTDPTCDASNGNLPGSVTITLSFTNNYAPTSAADISGPQAALYDWVWDDATKTLIGTNNAAIPVGALAAFTVNVTGLVETPAEGAPLTTLNWFSDSNPPVTNLDVSNDILSVGLNVDAALPVTLVSFAVSKEGKTAALKWATTMETNSDRFEIQRSLAGKDWQMIGTVASHGESTTEKKYTFTDRNPANGENLYRLKMIDKDQTFAYSRIQSVKFEGGSAGDMSVYPNPSIDKLHIRNFSNVKAVVITDMSGHTVLQSGFMATDEINVQGLASGIYAVKVTRTDGSFNTQKIVIGK